MKKTIFSVLAAVTVATSAMAQDYKQAAGNKSLEFQLAPLGGSPISIGGISFRKFTTDKMAWRVNAFIGMSSKSDKPVPADTASGKLETTHKSSTFNVTLQPGVIWFMEGTDRLAPYWGAQIDFGMQMSTDKAQDNVAGTTPKSYTIGTTTTKGTDGFTRIGAGLVAGFDYYIAKKLFLGAEMGFGFALNSKSTIKTTIDGYPAGAKAPADVKQGSDFTFGPNAQAKLRLGFLF